MKKAISIFLTLLLVACSIAQVTFADSNSPDDRSLENFINKLEDSGVSQEEIELLRQSKTEPEVVYSDTINEYKLYKELANKTDNELKSLGMSEDTIANLRNLNFTDELIKRSKLDDNALSSMGYTKKQIKMLRNFKGTESEIIALAATLSASGTVNYLYYYQSEDNSAATFSYSWSWSAVVVNKKCAKKAEKFEQANKHEDINFYGRKSESSFGQRLISL